jgi:hypothetical protein
MTRSASAFGKKAAKMLRSRDLHFEDIDEVLLMAVCSARETAGPITVSLYYKHMSKKYTRGLGRHSVPRGSPCARGFNGSIPGRLSVPTQSLRTALAFQLRLSLQLTTWDRKYQRRTVLLILLPSAQRFLHVCLNCFHVIFFHFRLKFLTFHGRVRSLQRYLQFFALATLSIVSLATFLTKMVKLLLISVSATVFAARPPFSLLLTLLFSHV